MTDFERDVYIFLIGVGIGVAIVCIWQLNKALKSLRNPTDKEA